jgi:hypothetical protein
VLALVVVAVSSVAYAEPSAAELQATGEQLAKDGRFSEAIDAFKAADHLQPTAGHACLIALAYTRRELWPQAEIFLARCHERATPSDPLPDWAPVAEQQIAERLATANAAPVTIEVTPSDAKVQLTVSSFAPDETFGPRTIHLPPGQHVIIADAPGYATARVEVNISNKEPKLVTITLAPESIGEVRRVAPMHGELAVDGGRQTIRPSIWTKRLVVGGLALAGAGLVTYGWMGYEWNQMRSGSAAQWDAHQSNYALSRGLTIGLWAVGGAAVITGLVLPHHDERAPAVAAMPIAGGGMAFVGWSR